MADKRPKPLATIGSGSSKVELHRAKFHPFESVKFLNAAALKKSARANVEIGHLEGGGIEVTIAAELRHGAIKKIRPLACKACKEKLSGAGRGRRHAHADRRKKLLREALVQASKFRFPTTKLPIPGLSPDLISIPIGPIIIIIGGGSGIDFCISYTTDDGFYCLDCLFTPMPLCIGHVVVN